MDKYIKVEDLLKLIDEHQKQIKQEYEENKMSQMSMIAMTGALEVLKMQIK